MKETGIIMSGDHPKLILDGKKTMTRRVVTPHTSAVGVGRVDWSKFDWDGKDTFDFGESCYSTESEYVPDELKGQKIGIKNAPLPLVDGKANKYYPYEHQYLHVAWNWSEDATIFRIYPKWERGDRLWVRETWAAPFGYDALSPAGLWDKPKIWYFANGQPPKNFGIKRPSLFMPCWASRITLEITGIRVERLQEITENDIMCEGCPHDLNGRYTWFMSIWDSLNAKRGYGWEVNPWVWVIGFKKLDANWGG